MFRTLFAILYAIIFLIIGSPMLLIESAKEKKNKEKADLSSLRIVQRALRCVYRICGVRPTVIGMDRIPKDEPVLYVCNHQSYFDIIVGYSLCPGLTGYIAKDDLEKVPFLRTWMRRLYCLFMNRNDARAGLKTILEAIEYVKKGVSICIFPEGTRGDGKTLGEFHAGSLKIAEKTGCPIIPVAISNTHAVFLDHPPFAKPTHVIFEYGEPIRTNGMTREDKKNLSATVKAAIQEMLDRNQELI